MSVCFCASTDCRVRRKVSLSGVASPITSIVTGVPVVTLGGMPVPGDSGGGSDVISTCGPELRLMCASTKTNNYTKSRSSNDFGNGLLSPPRTVSSGGDNDSSSE